LDETLDMIILDPDLSQGPKVYHNVFEIDAKSAYPTIISKLNPSILPYGKQLLAYLGHLITTRKNNQQLGPACKLMANIVYGVISVWNPELGKEIMLVMNTSAKKLKELLQQANLKVIYGVTDSLFIEIQDEVQQLPLLKEVVEEYNATEILCFELVKNFKLFARTAKKTGYCSITNDGYFDCNNLILALPAMTIFETFIHNHLLKKLINSAGKKQIIPDVEESIERSFNEICKGRNWPNLLAPGLMKRRSKPTKSNFEHIQFSNPEEMKLLLETSTLHGYLFYFNLPSVTRRQTQIKEMDSLFFQTKIVILRQLKEDWAGLFP